MHLTTLDSDFRARTASRRSSSNVDDWTRSHSRSTCTTKTKHWGGKIKNCGRIYI